MDPSLVMRFARTVQAFTEASHDLADRFARAHDLGTADVRALTILATAGQPMLAGELARRVGLSSGAASRLVDRLEASGHAIRTTDSVDRRRVLVSHTDTARDIAMAWFGPLTVRLGDRLATLDDDQARVVIEVLDGVIEDVRATGS